MDVAPVSASSCISGATSSKRKPAKTNGQKGTNHEHHKSIRATILLKVEEETS